MAGRRGTADPATARHLQRGRDSVLAASRETRAVVWNTEFLRASFDYRPEAAGHADFRLQAARCLRRDRSRFLQLVANQVAVAVENALAFHEIETLRDQLAKEKAYLEEEVRTEHEFGEIIGESDALRRVLRTSRP